MTACCPLCLAVTGDHRAARVPDGWNFQICEEHRAQSAEDARKPPPPRVVTLGSPDYSDVVVARFFAGDNSLSLMSLAATAVPGTSAVH
jgi:hypothetical protein